MRTVFPPAAIGFGVPGIFIVITEGWAMFFVALVASIALLALLLAARGFWLARHHAEQIFDEEIGGTGTNKGLGPKGLAYDHDPFNGQRGNTHPTDTEPGETR